MYQHHSNYSPSPVHYGGLERTLYQQPPSKYSFAPSPAYSQTAYSFSQSFLSYEQRKAPEIADFIQHHINKEYVFIPSDFLLPKRVSQPFVGRAEEIRPLVEEAFQKVMERPLPEDFTITILPEKEFRRLAPAGVVGLSINRKEINAVSDIFILADELDKVLLTVGHELGHILTKPLKDKRDEEAKAFAFSFAWMKAIKEHNIGELSLSLILDQPARNGLHDLAHNFVFNLLQKGKKALEIYLELIRGGLTLVPD